MIRKSLLSYLHNIEITFIIMALTSLVVPFLYVRTSSVSNIVNEVAGILTVFSIIIVVIASIIFGINRLSSRLHIPLVWQLAEVLLTFFICYQVLRIHFELNQSPDKFEFRSYIGFNLLGTVFVYLFQKGLFIREQVTEKIRQAEILQKEFAQYRLQALKNQINPHFLFNSLSVLSSLVHKDPNLAETFVLRLSDAYTYILNQKEAGLVPLKEELNFLRSYFFLLQIRFENKIILDLQLTQEDDYFIPPLILQLLLENAVKHNRMSASQPLTFRITQEGSKLIVANNINKRDKQEDSTGLGLENIRKRYLLMNDTDVKIVQDNETFSVTIPLIKQPLK